MTRKGRKFVRALIAEREAEASRREAELPFLGGARGRRALARVLHRAQERLREAVSDFAADAAGADLYVAWRTGEVIAPLRERGLTRLEDA